MLTIYKYPIETIAKQTIALPASARILTVQTQKNVPYLWAEVDPQENLRERTILIYGTGHPISQDIKQRYIGTYQEHAGNLIWHVYEKIE